MRMPFFCSRQLRTGTVDIPFHAFMGLEPFFVCLGLHLAPCDHGECHFPGLHQDDEPCSVLYQAGELGPYHVSMFIFSFRSGNPANKLLCSTRPRKKALKRFCSLVFWTLTTLGFDYVRVKRCSVWPTLEVYLQSAPSIGSINELETLDPSIFCAVCLCFLLEILGCPTKCKPSRSKKKSPKPY